MIEARKRLQNIDLYHECKGVVVYLKSIKQVKSALKFICLFVYFVYEFTLYCMHNDVYNAKCDLQL